MQYSRDCITITSNNLFFHFQKHPHLRGENASVMSKKDAIWETSPPAWGKLREEVDFDSSHWKHPHLRGENFLSVQ